MKSLSRVGTVAAIFAMAALSACATKPDPQHMQHEPGAAPMDMQAMCEMHKKMSAKSPAERKAMMDEHMKTTTPEMMEKHMKMMEECK